MKPIIFALIISEMLLCLSCTPDCCDEPAYSILKFKDGKDSLINYVYVNLNNDKTRMIAYPSAIDYEIIRDTAFDVYKSYYYEQPNYGVNTAYLNLTIKKFIEVGDTISAKTLEGLIYERDPYSEFYRDESNYLIKKCPECPLDTVMSVLDLTKFHTLVDEGELGKYLKRLK